MGSLLSCLFLTQLQHSIDMGVRTLAEHRGAFVSFLRKQTRRKKKKNLQEALQVFDICSKLSLSSKSPVGKVFTGFQGAVCSTNPSSFITGSRDVPSIHFLPRPIIKLGASPTDLLNVMAGKSEISRCYLLKCNYTKPCV